MDTLLGIGLVALVCGLLMILVFRVFTKGSAPGNSGVIGWALLVAVPGMLSVLYGVAILLFACFGSMHEFTSWPFALPLLALIIWIITLFAILW